MSVATVCPLSTRMWAAATVLTMTPGNERPGRVIILNGGSSGGKTTLGRALQSAMPGPWLLLGIDLLIWTLPPEMINDPDGLSIHEGVITRGQLFTPLYEGFQCGVAALARSGVDVLVDDLTLDGLVDQQRWDNALQGLDVIWIGVRCAPQIAAERESRRGTRLPGIARHQAESVHAGVHYDIEVDTGELDLHEELSVIAEALRQRWSLMMTTESSPKATLPPTSAWMPEGVIRPPPWES
jgi:chloramphenicol 3-O phosphotransferase